MDLNERDGTWKPKGPTLFDLRMPHSQLELEALKLRASRKDGVRGLKRLNQVYNQKEGDYLVEYEWWEQEQVEDDAP